jgi:hypothetical protein
MTPAMTVQTHSPFSNHSRLRKKRRAASQVAEMRRAIGILSVVGLVLGALVLVLPISAQADPLYAITSFTAHTTNEAGVDYTVAGGHPDHNLVEFTFPTLASGLPVESLKDASVTLPPGFFGNPVAAPLCPLGDVRVDGNNEDVSTCPPGSAVGSIHILNGASQSRPLYNVAPPRGYPAAFAFRYLGNIVLLFVTPLPRTASYGLEVGATNAAQEISIAGISTTFFGVPSQHGSGSTEAPFLSNPLDCSEAQPTWRIAADSWQHVGSYLPSDFPDLSDPDWKTAGVITPPVAGCEDPALTSQFAQTGLGVKPLQGGGATQADSPTGLAVDLDFPQSNDPTDLNTTFDPSIPQAPEPKDITVKLPAGLSINPSSAGGLGACSDLASNPAGDQVHYDNTKPVTCPDASKIGSVTALSPLLALHEPVTDKIVGPEPIPGAVYLLAPHPGDLPVGGGTQSGKFRLLIQLENERYGVNFKLPGVATADPNTGQLTATFTENPQLPASHITVNLIEGPRAPLATPVTCGGFGSTSDIVPWSSPGTPDAHPTASFNVGSGPNGSPCPLSAANRPFAPAMSAGTESNGAGQPSPFDLHLIRQDGEQELSSLEATLPKGLAAKFIGVPYCSEAALATAAGRSGQAEQANPTCPASRIGSVTAGIGPGSNPFYAHGTAYLAGPYKGAPLSVAVITPAVTGPFDLGTVVVRTALFINPETAQGHIVSDAFPEILDGVPLRLRSIDVRLDRRDFIRNPTNCKPLAVQTTIHSTDGATVSPSNFFQAGDCRALGFKPRLSLALKGGTKRSDNPALTATVTYPKGSNANIAFTSVTLPHSEFLDNAHIRNPCTRVVFAAGSTPGERCPSSSVIGFARAETPLFDKPLEGPVYLRSSSHKLPDVVAALKGQIFVELDGRIDAVHERLRTTFENVPDAPVSKFTLSLFGAKKGLLVNSENLCRAPQVASVKMVGQNGKAHDTKPLIGNDCKKLKQSSRRHGRGR